MDTLILWWLALLARLARLPFLFPDRVRTCTLADGPDVLSGPLCRFYGGADATVARSGLICLVTPAESKTGVAQRWGPYGLHICERAASLDPSLRWDDRWRQAGARNAGAIARAQPPPWPLGFYFLFRFSIFGAREPRHWFRREK
jgi:hypothetical protein